MGAFSTEVRVTTANDEQRQPENEVNSFQRDSMASLNCKKD